MEPQGLDSAVCKGNMPDFVMNTTMWEETAKMQSLETAIKISKEIPSRRLKTNLLAARIMQYLENHYGTVVTEA